MAQEHEQAIIDKVFPLFDKISLLEIRNRAGQYECGVASPDSSRIDWHTIQGLPIELPMDTLETVLNKFEYVTSAQGNSILVSRPMVSQRKTPDGKALQKRMSIAQEIAKSAFPQEAQEHSDQVTIIFNVMSYNVFPLFRECKIRSVVFSNATDNVVCELPDGSFKILNGMPCRLFPLAIIQSELEDYGFNVSCVNDVESGQIVSVIASLPIKF